MDSDDLEKTSTSSPPSSFWSERSFGKAKALSTWKYRKLASSRRTIFLVVGLLLAIVALALGLGLGLGLQSHQAISTAVHPIVDLGYAQYRGNNSSGVASWLGIRYAATPIGRLRFAAPQPPKPQKGVQSGLHHGNKCLSVRRKSASNPSSLGHSEDCLFVDVYSPANATSDSRLPVYVYLQGGGFTSNGGTYDGSPLIRASGMQLVVVMLNYRVGPHGFLASEEVRKGGSLNNGLKDQRQALRWVKEHISKFGGSPDHVVLGGASAGGASVTLQLAAYGGKDEGLFHATAAESQSFGALRTVEESQYQYDELVSRTKCDMDHTGSNDTLACLRKLNSSALQGQNINTKFPGTTQTPLFAYNPTLDFDLIPDYTFNLFASGSFLKLPAIYGDTTNEGTVFVASGTSTSTQANDWLQAQFPLLNSTQKEWFTKTYPPAEQFPNKGKYWRSTSDAYGELRYICPGIYLNNLYVEYGVEDNWNYHYAVLDPKDEKDGAGTPHVAELNAIWGAPPGSPLSYQTTNADMIPIMQGYWSSFIRVFDPNTYRHPGAPSWGKWTAKRFDNDEKGRTRILIQNNGINQTKMETVNQEQWERCRKLTSWGLALAQ